MYLFSQYTPRLQQFHPSSQVLSPCAFVRWPVSFEVHLFADCTLPSGPLVIACLCYNSGEWLRGNMFMELTKAPKFESDIIRKVKWTTIFMLFSGHFNAEKMKKKSVTCKSTNKTSHLIVHTQASTLYFYSSAPVRLDCKVVNGTNPLHKKELRYT